MWLRRERDCGIVQKKREVDSGQPNRHSCSPSSPNFQDQPQKIPQLRPPERQSSRQGGFPTQLCPAHRPVEVRVHLKRDQNSGSWQNGSALSHLVTLTPQASSPSTWGRSDESHQARLPPGRPGLLVALRSLGTHRSFYDAPWKQRWNASGVVRAAIVLPVKEPNAC